MWGLDAGPHEITLPKIKHTRLKEKYDNVGNTLQNFVVLIAFMYFVNHFEI
jgi:hypothetical protein